MGTSIIRSAAPPSLSTEVIVLLRVKSRKSLQQNNLTANGLPRWDSFKKRENSGPVMLQGGLSAPGREFASGNLHSVCWFVPHWTKKVALRALTACC